jgi:hypothetical protein
VIESYCENHEPALSSPNIQTLSSFCPNSELHNEEKATPMLTSLDKKAQDDGIDFRG